MVDASQKTKHVVLCIVITTILYSSALTPLITSASPSVPLKNGPFVDKLRFEVITQDDQQIEALLDDEVDIVGDMIDPTFLGTLLEAEDVQVLEVPRNGYGYMTINCAKYPLNITDFRRALAFALDKEAISDDIWEGLSNPQDSVIPSINPFSIEGQLDYSYYGADVDYGNYLLDRAEFEFNETSGFRSAPNGEPFSILIETAMSSNIAIEVGQYTADALVDLGVNATSVPTDFYIYLNNLYFHKDYDMVFLGSTFSNYAVDWLATEFYSENALEPYLNFPNFQNATFDSLRAQLLYSVNYDEVYEAAIEMQRLLTYECPIIVCYANVLLSAHRTDRFEGFVNDASSIPFSSGADSWWSCYKVHLKDSAGGPFGGTLRFSNPLDIDTFNFMVSPGSRTYYTGLLWDSLLKSDPMGNVIPWLAESYMIETHADNPSVTSGHTRITFKILANATWTDGTPLTADDVGFSLCYYMDSPGNPYGPDLNSVTAAYSTATEVIVEFNSESYWNLQACSFKPIIPKHVFAEIGIYGWNIWNPDPRIEPMVTSGPFNISGYEPGGYLEMSVNPNYFFSPDLSSFATEFLENESSTDIFVQFFQALTPLSILVSSTSIVVIIGVVIIWKNETQTD
ncbi:MAG: ABC transporter substrate-binding protein [Candidatus Thorarchaeota archaeon]